MKIVFITFSNTGNTNFVATKLSEILESKIKCQIKHIDAIEGIKQLDLSDSSHPQILLDSKNQIPQNILELRTLIQEADVIGIGAFSNAYQPSFGLSSLFEEEVLPSSLFNNVKYFFVYSTCGRKIGKTTDVLGTVIRSKTKNAQFLGSLVVIAPGNYPLFQPKKPYQYPWDKQEISKIDLFGEELSKYLSGEKQPTNLSFNFTPFKFNPLMKFAGKLTGYPKVDKTKCIKCGICEQKCPYNAVRLLPDIEDGFPTIDRSKCLACGRCFNLCSKEAMEIPRIHTELRTRYPEPFFLETGQKNENGIISLPPSRTIDSLRNTFIGQSKLLILLFAILLIILYINK